MLLPLCVGKRRLRASPGRRGQFKTIRIGVAEPNGECKTGSIGLVVKLVIHKIEHQVVVEVCNARDIVKDLFQALF